MDDNLFDKTLELVLDLEIVTNTYSYDTFISYKVLSYTIPSKTTTSNLSNIDVDLAYNDA